MPVYHFTLHAYRSWSPAHRRGYTQRGKGYQPSDPRKAEEYDERAKQEKVTFDTLIQEVLILGAEDICRQRGWRLHGVGTEPSHVHMVVSWKIYLPWREVMEKLKNVLSLFLGRVAGQKGRRWFVTGGSRKRVENTEHLTYLLNEYLPDHPGLYWREGMALPEDRKGVLNPKK